MRKIRGGWIPVVAVVLVLFSPAFAFAYIYDWTLPSVQVVTDPAGDSRRGTGTDILAAYHAYNGIYHYFRMDLAAAPTPIDHNEALTYGFYIDYKPGGAPAGPWNTTHPNVPVPGIDLIVLSATNAPSSPIAWLGNVTKEWVANVSDFNNRFYFTEVPRINQFQYTEGGGTILEWRYGDNGILGANFTWVAANVGPTGEYFNDMTTATVTPIPSAVWLLGSGIIGLVGLKRRQARRS